MYSVKQKSNKNETITHFKDLKGLNNKIL